MLDTAKAVLRGEFIALNKYIRNEERFEINNLSSRSQKKIKFKVRKWKLIIKMYNKIHWNYKHEVQNTQKIKQKSGSW